MRRLGRLLARWPLSIAAGTVAVHLFAVEPGIRLGLGLASVLPVPFGGYLFRSILWLMKNLSP